MSVELLALQPSALPAAANKQTSEPGVVFSIRIDGAEHSCLVANCALKRLYAFEGTTLDIQHVYQAYQPKIHNVARNLILSGQSRPEPMLVLRAPHFSSGEA